VDHDRGAEFLSSLRLASRSVDPPARTVHDLPLKPGEIEHVPVAVALRLAPD
jgi:hypothetical protein